MKHLIPVAVAIVLSMNAHAEDSKLAAKAFGITFKVPDELVAKYKSDYQIDLEAASGQNHHLLPHPAVFIVGRDGIIRFAHVNPDYKSRLDPAEILKAAGESAVPAEPDSPQP